jgi:SAM-dependent methyltransferase
MRLGRRAHDVAADAWDAAYGTGPLYHGPAPPPHFSLPAGSLALDIGCGAGKSLAALRQAGPGSRVVGLDASRPGLRRARALAPVLQARAEALPLRGACADAVRVHHLLGHLAPGERLRAAGEVERVLRPGGFLDVRELAAGDLRHRGPRDDVRGGLPMHFFDAAELAALFPRCRGDARVEARAVRFDERGRRVAVLRARRARDCVQKD